MATLGAGGSASVKLPGNIRGSAVASGGLAIGGNWDVALFGAAGGGPTTAGTGAAGGLLVGGSNNARSVNDLRAFFSFMSGQAGPVSVSRFSGYGAKHNKVTGVEAVVGLGAGRSASAGGTYTWMSPTINLMGLIGC